MVLAKMNESESNWLSCVNYARYEKDANLVSFHTKIGVFYITFRPIPAYTELLVHDRDNYFEDRKGYERKYTGSSKDKESIDLPVKGNCRSESYSNKFELEYNASKVEETMENIPLISRVMGSLSHTADKISLISGKEGKSNATNEEKFTNNGNLFQTKCKCNESKNGLFRDTENPNAHKGKVSREERETYEPDKNIFQTEKGPTYQERKEMDDKRNCKGVCKFRERNQLIRHDRIHNGQKPFVCYDCDKKFASKSNLNLHQRIHTGQKSFECTARGKKFTRRCHFIRHERIHTGQKPFECSICGKKFVRRHDLNMHERIHTGQKLFQCIACGKKFTQRYQLSRHERIHTGQKPFGCNVCGMKFTQSSNLIRHERIHTGEKPFVCNVCGVKFARQGTLKEHERIHTGQRPFVCKACGKKFARKGSLNTHKRIHTGQKPFVCKACGKKFTRKSHLNMHERIHTCQKSFECTACGKKFTRSCHLIRHEKIHSSQKPC